MTGLPKAYFAAPLFNDRERNFNSEVAERLELHCEVFLPQRDGQLLSELVDDGMASSLAERRVFRADAAALRSATLLVAILDGGHIDEGVAFEIGFANGLDICCVGLQTDSRRALLSGNNPMISQGLKCIFSDVASLVDWVGCWSEDQRGHITKAIA
jgi:nucleoside 2-deoxyribosyltransferase